MKGDGKRLVVIGIGFLSVLAAPFVALAFIVVLGASIACDLGGHVVHLFTRRTR